MIWADLQVQMVPSMAPEMSKVMQEIKKKLNETLGKDAVISSSPEVGPWPPCFGSWGIEEDDSTSKASFKYMLDHPKMHTHTHLLYWFNLVYVFMILYVFVFMSVMGCVCATSEV